MPGSTVSDVVAYLNDKGHADAAERAEKEEIDWDALELLEVKDFMTLGLKLGPAKKLVMELKRAKGEVGSVLDYPHLQTFQYSTKELNSVRALETLKPGMEDAVPVAQKALDYTLLLGAERTFFAGQQMAWNVIFVGMGLMMVSVKDSAPEVCGVLSILGGLLFSVCSVFFYLYRLRQINRRAPPTWLESAIYTGTVALLLIGAASIELAYGLVYPYLSRSKIVEFSSESNL